MQVDLKVAQLLNSRLCHDLVGPSGAVHNGMELFEEGDSDVGGEALALVSASVGQLSARLAFFRMAFGLGGLSGRNPRLVEARELTADYLSGSRVTLDWTIDQPAGSDQQLPVPTIKLLLNMILVAVDALPRGGTIGVSIARLSEAGGIEGTGLAIKASGEGARMKENLLAALGPDTGTEAEETLSAHTVHGYFCQKLAQSLSGEVELSFGEDEVQLAVLVPDIKES